MDEEILISQCLNGERERDCSYCPAQPAKGGACCFGIHHEYGDQDCHACELETECAPLTHGEVKIDRPRTPRIIYPGGRSANRSRGSRTHTRTNTRRPTQQAEDVGPQQGEPLLVENPFEPQPVQFNQDDGLFARFLKVGAWGAGEGFLEMGLNFFRKRRPE